MHTALEIKLTSPATLKSSSHSNYKGADKYNNQGVKCKKALNSIVHRGLDQSQLHVVRKCTQLHCKDYYYVWRNSIGDSNNNE